MRWALVLFGLATALSAMSLGSTVAAQSREGNGGAPSGPEAAEEEPAAEQTADAAADVSRDAEARSVFEAGSTAFRDARYADALAYFRRAYELSGRAQLLYNIGVAADRLRRDAEALEAFERFLEEAPEHPRRRDAQARVEVLREAVARGEQAPVEPLPAAGVAAPSDGPADAGASGALELLTVVGASSLGAAGLAGVIAALVGIAGAGECLETAGGVCVEERQTAWAGTGTYLGLGLAAIAGAVVWLVVDLTGGEGDEDASVRVGPNGELTWSF
jgi:tetratricopeptide (TPR) repeat protein